MMVPELVAQRRLTLADYEALPDDQDYEIIDGALCMSPRARAKHQVVANRFSVRITNLVEPQGLGMVVPDADLIVDDLNTYVSPDIMFFSAAKYRAIRPDDWIRVIPDLIVEVLSPGTELYDLKTKRELYQRLGVPHYWIADGGEHTLAEHVLEANGEYRVRKVGADEIFRPELFPDFEIKLSDIFRE